MHPRLLLVATGALLVAGCGAASSTPLPSPSAVARVGSTTISASAFALRFTRALTLIRQAGGPAGNAAMTTGIRARVLRSLIIDAVIAQEAARDGVAATSADVDAAIAEDTRAAGGPSQLQSQLAALGESMDQLRDAVRSSLNEQRVEDLAARTRATEVEQQLSGGADFARLAGVYSDDSDTATKGGDLGVVPAATIRSGDSSYAQAVLALRPGQVTNPPVRDNQGYDIVQLTSLSPAGLALRHIIVHAPRPYTVKERPAWFTQALFGALQQDCSARLIQVYLQDTGPDPCAGVASHPSSPQGSASPSPAASPQASASPSR